MSMWKPGQPISARKLNQHSAEIAVRDLGGAPGASSAFGSLTAMDVRDLSETGMWIRVFDGKQVEGDVGITQTIWQYSWESVWFDNAAKRWRRHEASYGHVDSDPATSVTRGTLTETPASALSPEIENPDVKVYLAARDPVTNRIVVSETGGSQVAFRGKDVVLMILGPYQDFTSCPGAPTHLPPVATDANCPPAYAWSGYKVCGYRMKKVSTFLTSSTSEVAGLGFWATGLNGESTTAWRRFHRAYWGWDTEQSSVLDPTVACAGVRFEVPAAGALNCTCPTWLSSVACFRVRVKYVADPGPPSGSTCTACYEKMAGFWGTEQTAILCNSGMGCVWQSNEGPSPFGSATATYQPVYEIDPCWTGPDEFDPCNPCDGFGTLSVGINDASSPSGCGGPGNLYVGGRVSSLNALKNFVNACANGENPPALTLTNITKSGVCPNYIEWIKLECCSCEESNAECGTTLDCGIIDGGNPGSLPTDSIDGGSPGSLPTNTIDGGVI